MFFEHIERVIHDCRIPDVFWEGYFGIIGIGLTLLLLKGNLKKYIRNSSLLLLIMYLVLIYCCTIIFRNTEIKDIHLMPMWSYYCILQGKIDFICDVLLNVALFIPLGFLVGVYAGANKLIRVVIFTFFLSGGVETAQYFFHKGVPEIDDVLHNIVGGIIGYGFVVFLIRISKLKFKKTIVMGCFL